ncbi:hypothetical protein Q0Z83_001790 [Actinoplanes sichuanensis]|uniref:ATP-binding protein n=1 Tax=Actinoplanes sichuanensis TaxID=512349 RepID=A0ABW4ASW8_9ACTN|nr:hypothetical protein [Actinoplanes sichuanensis]BEL01988.1 hypothetical protein Q0Z83_001790 [Actinoplanes sichuanensis]
MIEPDQRLVLTDLRRLDRAATDDVWTDLETHLDDLNEAAAAAVLQAFEEAEARRTGSPPGVVVEGGPGSGRTHLLRWARERVQQREGYFFAMGLTDGHAFWAAVVHTLLRGLRRSGHYRHSQLAMFLERLSERAEIPSTLRRQIRGQAPLTPAALDAFVTGVRTADPEAGRDCRFTLRALVLLAATDPDVADLGESWLLSLAEPAPADAERWGLPRVGKSEQDVAVEISRLLALTGPSLLAVHRIDVILAQSAPAHTVAATSPAADSAPGGSEHIAAGLGQSGSGRTAAMVVDLSRGLSDLREKLFRTVTVVACRPASWRLIRDGAPGDHFRPEIRLEPLPSRAVAERLIAARFTPFFEAAEFKPPYPTWPIRPEAFDGTPGHTPRQLIDHAGRHIRRCLARNEILSPADLGAHRDREAPPVDVERLARLGERLTRLAAEADVTAALDPATEDAVMPRLLAAGLRAWVIERGGGRFTVPPVEPGHPAAHAWLCESLDPATGDEAHWYLRGLAHPGARAVQARLARLRSVAALDPAVRRRRVIVLRDDEWPGGPVGDRVRREFLDLGGTITAVGLDDLRVFAALAVLLDEDDPVLPEFLRAQRPAAGTALLGTLLGDTAR